MERGENRGKRGRQTKIDKTQRDGTTRQTKKKDR